MLGTKFVGKGDMGPYLLRKKKNFKLFFGKDSDIDIGIKEVDKKFIRIEVFIEIPSGNIKESIIKVINKVSPRLFSSKNIEEMKYNINNMMTTNYHKYDKYKVK